MPASKISKRLLMQYKRRSKLIKAVHDDDVRHEVFFMAMKDAVDHIDTQKKEEKLSPPPRTPSVRID